MVVPVDILRCFQRIRQPGQIVILRQFIGAGTSEVILPTCQFRVDTKLESHFRKIFLEAPGGSIPRYVACELSYSCQKSIVLATAM